MDDDLRKVQLFIDTETKVLFANENCNILFQTLWPFVLMFFIYCFE